jgi:D-alanine-D-alanine ligase-like ATP-grasp enzyme
MDLEQFAIEAAAAGAVVFNALQGDISHSGWLQRYLAAAGVAFTGPRWESAAVSGDKVRLSFCALSAAA